MTSAASQQASEAPAPRHDLVIISASASQTSRSEMVGDYLERLLTNDYGSIAHIRVRELPPAALARADVDDGAIADALSKLAQANAVVVITPTYKGSYSGLLKIFIDLLPQYALRGKVVLPLATGGTIAHMQMMDHALRPVLQTMWPRHIAQGCFLLDQHIERDESGGISLAENNVPLLFEVITAFEQMVAL
ncbi:NADPH-dependent FMN reductase [Sphingobium amiense]|nr:NADPH-dependent FMN reductase [Sphingobium amiense]